MEPDLALMERVFGTLKHDWVWDFFFASDASELDMLRHAVSTGSASTAEMDVSTLCSDPVLEIYNMGEKARFLLMTSFSTADITVGFGINEQIATNPGSIFVRERYLGRVARDDSNGTVLFISEDFSEHLTEVCFFGLDSPCRREQLFALCHSKRLKRVMEEFKHRKAWDLEKLKKTLVYFFRAKEGRLCPSCGKGPSECSCKLVLRRKTHALDMETDIANLRSYVGGFTGVGALQLMTQGDTLFQGAYDVRTNMRITMDAEAKQRLVAFALCDAARKCTPNPLAFRMSSRGMSSSTSQISPLDTFLLASIADSVLQEDDGVPLLKSAQSASSDTDVYMHDAEKDMEEDSCPQEDVKPKNSASSFGDLSDLLSPRLSSSSLLLTAPIVAPVLPVVSNPSPPAAPLPSTSSSTLVTTPSSNTSTPTPSALRQSVIIKPGASETGHSEAAVVPNVESGSVSVAPGTKAKRTAEPSAGGTRIQSFARFASSNPKRTAAACDAKKSEGGQRTEPEGGSTMSDVQTVTYVPLSPPGNEPATNTARQKLTSATDGSQTVQTLPGSKVGSVGTGNSLSNVGAAGYASVQSGKHAAGAGVASSSTLRSPVVMTSAPVQSTGLGSGPMTLGAGSGTLAGEQRRAGTTVSASPLSGGGGGVAITPVTSQTQGHTGRMTSQGHRPLAIPALATQESLVSSGSATGLPGVSTMDARGYGQNVTTGVTRGSMYPQNILGIVSNGLGTGGGGAGDGLRRPGQTIATRIAPMPIQARYILPSGAVSGPGVGGAVGGIDKNGEEMDERKRKAEQRKARNRESAQRSNHKRKLMIQALKDDIAAAVSQEAHLRAREKLLREENRELRKAMASK